MPTLLHCCRVDSWVARQMFFLEEGQAEASVQGAVVMSYAVGDCFGELALLGNEPRRATITATGPSGARCLVLGREPFELIASKNAALLESMRSQYTSENFDATGSAQGSEDAGDKRDEQEAAAQQPREEDKAEEGAAATPKKLQGEDEDERYQDLAAATQTSMTVEEHMALAEQSYALGSEADKQVALQHFQVAAGNAIGRLFWPC